MSKFQIIVLATFILFLIVGVAVFATYKGSDSTQALPEITLWGTFPAATFNQYISSVNNSLAQPVRVNYVEKKTADFSSDFVEALARGKGPDGILVPTDVLLPHEDKLALIPYSALPERTFRDTYIQEGELYLSQNGILAIPFTVDPLIMYWNRDLFDAAGLATYPRTWDEFVGLNQKLTSKDDRGNIRRSAIALGDFSNVTNAREILGTLLLQLGNPVTEQPVGQYAASTIKPTGKTNPTPALQFFTQFVDPSNASYSWNRGMPQSKAAFLSGILATYFGFASELRDIRNKNPNLNFDAAPLPQAKNAARKATYGRMYGFSIVRASANPNVVYQVISVLTSRQSLTTLSDTMYIPGVRRDMVGRNVDDPYFGIFDASALIARGWLDADPAISRQIFADMVQSITSGQKQIYQAINDAASQYDVALTKAMK